MKKRLYILLSLLAFVVSNNAARAGVECYQENHDKISSTGVEPMPKGDITIRN